jgi:hypothetical protein
MLHITQTDRQTDIDRSIDLCLFSLSLSLSIHSLGSCCLHTLSLSLSLSPTRAQLITLHTRCSMSCLVGGEEGGGVVCIWLPFEQYIMLQTSR